MGGVGRGRVQEADQREVSLGYCTHRDPPSISTLAEERERETKGSVF